MVSAEGGLIRGFIRLPEERLEAWLPLLKKIYEFESGRVAGPGSSRRDIREVLWSFDELVESHALSREERATLEDLIGYLQRHRQLMRIPGHDGGPERFVTRVAETVRLLGHTYEYWYRGRPGIEAVRWLVEYKEIPGYTIPAPEFLERLLETVTGKLGEEMPPNLPTAIRLAVEGVATSLGGGPWEAAAFSEFQLASTTEMLLAQYDGDHRPDSQILTAGVGSGKTIGFGLAVLVSALDGILGGEDSRRCHLLVYPRKALAQNQYHVFRGYARAVDVGQLSVHLEHTSFYKGPGGYSSVKEGIEDIYGGPDPPPDIVITTFETLKRRLQHPLVVRKLRNHLVRVVLDEVHLAEGLSGAHIAMLMSRLQGIVQPKRLLWTASSATVARPDDHAARLFGIPASEVAVILPSEEELVNVGIAHHVFLRPSVLTSNLGVLVNATSLLVHNRRHDLGSRPEKDEEREKTIGFADNLDLLGRWNADLKENERTEDAKDRRRHPRQSNRNQWTWRQREIPYALRYRRPLQRRIKIASRLGDDPEDSYEPVLQDAGGLDLCSRCMNGERISLGAVDAETLLALSRIAYRDPHLESDGSLKAMRVQNPVFVGDSEEIGTLDLCPYLRAGACMWFPQGDDQAVEEIPGSSGHYEWRDVARSAIHSSKRESGVDELEEDIAEIVFRESVRRVYEVGPTHVRVPVDIVLASPSLEVGVDLPMLTESIMTKAIRNVASYRQKTGRVGRETGMDVLHVTLVTDSPIDLHYYRQPRKLVSSGRLEPIPMKDRNEAVRHSAMYMAIWDWLAREADLPEAIPTRIRSDGTTDFTERLEACRKKL